MDAKERLLKTSQENAREEADDQEVIRKKPETTNNIVNPQLPFLTIKKTITEGDFQIAQYEFTTAAPTITEVLNAMQHTLNMTRDFDKKMTKTEKKQPTYTQ